MNLGLSSREKLLGFVTLLVVGYFLFWQILLGPLWNSIDRSGSEVKIMRIQLQQLAAANHQTTLALNDNQLTKLIFTKDVQLGKIIGFVEKRFSRLAIKLNFLDQSVLADRLAVKLQFSAGYDSLLAFLGSFSQLETYYSIENISIQEEDRKLVVNLEIQAPYKN